MQKVEHNAQNAVFSWFPNFKTRSQILKLCAGTRAIWWGQTNATWMLIRLNWDQTATSAGKPCSNKYCSMVNDKA